MIMKKIISIVFKAILNACGLGLGAPISAVKMGKSIQMASPRAWYLARCARIGPSEMMPMGSRCASIKRRASSQRAILGRCER